MATLAGNLTYLDWAKRLDPDGKMASIVELLSLNNEILDDMTVVEGNLPTGHKHTIRTGLPSATWRMLNYGVDQSKSSTAQIVDVCGNLEAESTLDVDVAKLNGNTAEFRLSESRAFIESMSQTMATTLIYGNVGVNPERFTGLAPRYASVSTGTAASAANVIDMGGSGSDNTSIWIVNWSPQTLFSIFPKGSKAGLSHEDKGVQRTLDPNNKWYYAWVDHYKWELGLSLADWRYCVRMCNIDVSDLATGSAANLINGLVRAFNRLPTAAQSAAPAASIGSSGVSGGPMISGPNGRTVIYCNRTVRTYLDLQAMNKTNVWLGISEWNGKPVTTFRGIPIRTVDAILNTEARVV